MLCFIYRSLEPFTNIHTQLILYHSFYGVCDSGNAKRKTNQKFDDDIDNLIEELGGFFQYDDLSNQQQPNQFLSQNHQPNQHEPIMQGLFDQQYIQITQQKEQYYYHGPIYQFPTQNQQPNQQGAITQELFNQQYPQFFQYPWQQQQQQIHY